MFGIFVVILFTLSFPCEGQINFPPGGDSLVVAPGDDATIAWTFNNTLSEVKSRFWSFKSSSPGSTFEDVAIIDRSGKLVYNSSLGLHPRVDIKDEATLVLKNVSSLHDGTYKFSIVGGGATDKSDVRLFIAKNFTVTTNCSSLINVTKGDDIRCLCTARIENPPVMLNVTWYKDDAQIGPTRNEQNMLALINVNGTSDGIYVCKAKGKYNLTGESNSTVVEVSVPPVVTSFTSSSNNPFRGKSVTLTCVASGRPEPTIIIKHNGKMVNNTTNTHTINDVEDSDKGLYECFAKNELGNSSKTLNLTVIAPPTTTTSSGMPSMPSTSTISVGPPKKTDDDDGPSTGLIAGIVIGVLLFLLILVFFLWWFKYRKEKSSGEHIGNDVVPGNQGNVTVTENTYESLADGEGKKSENLYEEARLGNDNGGAGSTRDTLPPVQATVDKDKKKNKKKDKKKNEPAPANTPPVYATVNKTRHNEPSVTYATLDTVAMQPTGSSKRDRRDQPTEYASIAEFGVKGDLV